MTIVDGLREIDAGDLEDLTDAASVETYLATSFAWAVGDLDRRMPGGPDGNEVFARYDDAIATLTDAGSDTVAAFSHGMAIRAWAARRAVNIDGSYASTHQLDNTGMVVLETDIIGGWRLLDWVEFPLGGTQIADAQAIDPTGQTLLRALQKLI